VAIDRGIRIIAFFKLLKGILLFGSGVGLLNLLHKDVADRVMQWINILHVDPDNRYIQNLLVKASIVNERQLKRLSVGAFFYAGLLLTEGSGLLLGKRWAKYFSVIVTGSFIPLELWELVKQFNVNKTIVIGVNIIVVWYLILRLKRE